jgi:hypothetical protein
LNLPAWQERQAFVGNHYASEIYASPLIFWLNGTAACRYEREAAQSRRRSSAQGLRRLLCAGEPENEK